MAGSEYMLQFFTYEHLPASLQEASRPFCELAERIIATLPENPERTVCLRKILEAKDCAVRAVLAGQGGGISVRLVRADDVFEDPQKISNMLRDIATMVLDASGDEPDGELVIAECEQPRPIEEN